MEVNKLRTVDFWIKEQQAVIKDACSGGTPVSCETAVAAIDSAMVWPFLPEMMATTSLIGAGANGGVGYAINGEINPNDVILGYWTGLLTANTGIVDVNASGDAVSSYLKGDEPWKGSAISGIASGLSYSAGVVTGQSFNPMKPCKDWLWTDIDMGISKPLPMNPVPSIVGNTFGSVATAINLPKGNQ